MLRMGYSSEDLARDLNAKRFAGPLDSSSEAQIRQLNASPKLLDDLKSGRFDATTDQLTQAQEKIAATNAAAEDPARQQQIALQKGNNQKSTAPSGIDASQLGQERPQAVPKIIELKFYEILDLRDFDGPNIRLVVEAIDMDGVIINLSDYDHMNLVGYGSYESVSIKSKPTVTRKKVAKENNSLLYKSRGFRVIYIEAMDTRQGHVKIGIVSD